MKSSASKIQLTGYDALFQTSGPAEVNDNLVQEVPLSELFPFKNHPFQVRDDEAMQKTVESIARSGVLSPGIVRPRQEGGYEIIAGHRRKRGSELAGKATMPVLVRTLDDDEATIIMVDSNLQREKILPSEKAFAYKMKLEALKHQGQRRDLTLERGVPKLPARERIALEAGESCGLAITRYIALTKLIPPLLVLVDEDKLSFSTAADYISALTAQEQTNLVSVMDKLNLIPSKTYAAMLEEAQKYLGYPYVWGGSSPSTSFDCSGFVSWVINHSGWNVGRLGAQGLYNICTPVSMANAQPGDLIFFWHTYDAPNPNGVTHVGIYVGNGQMIHCGNPISYANINSNYWQQHFYGMGRLP